MTIHLSAKTYLQRSMECKNSNQNIPCFAYKTVQTINLTNMTADVLTSTLGHKQGYKFNCYPFYAFAVLYEMSVSFSLSLIRFRSRVSPSKNTFNREPCPINYFADSLCQEKYAVYTARLNCFSVLRI